MSHVVYKTSRLQSHIKKVDNLGCHYRTVPISETNYAL